MTTAMRSSLAEPKRSTSPPGAEVRRLLAAFLVGYEGHTRLAYARDLSDWLAFCDRHNVEPLSAHRAHVDAYARELTEVHGRARSTVARRLSAIAGFYRYATAEDSHRPLAGSRRPPARFRPTTARPPGSTGTSSGPCSALARQRAAAGAVGQSSRDLALLTALAHNGLRIGEALAATSRCTERGHRALHITAKAAAGQAVVLAPVTAGPTMTSPAGTPARCSSQPEADATTSRQRLPDGAPPRPGSRLGLRRPQLSPHSLRHAFVTRTGRRARRDVQDAAGHATRRYDRARHNLDRAATYAVTAYLAGDGP